MKPTLKLNSLPVQIFIRLAGVAILTATIAGIPIFFLIHNQLDRQAWSQVEQGLQASQSFYQIQLGELTSFTVMSASSPKLQQLLDQDEQEQVAAYLNSVLGDEWIDFLVICDSRKQVYTSTNPQIALSVCESARADFWVNTEILPQAWMLASSPVQLQDNHLGLLVSGVRMNGEFTNQMQQRIGLEQAILYQGRQLAASYPGNPQKRVIISPPTDYVELPELATCCTFELQRQPYYAARIALNESGLEAEVALGVADIIATEQRLIILLVSSLLVAALLGAVIGLFLTGQVTRPLVSLAGSASRFSQGDLIEPVTQSSNLVEIVKVSQALETARLDLKRTLTELRYERDWTKHLLESIVEGIITLDGENNITFFSQGAERITGLRRQEVLGRPCDEVFCTGENETSFSQSIPTPGQKSRLVVDLGDGRETALSITRARYTPVISDETQAVLVFRDVSEEELIHRLLGSFIANVAHEFRTPLSSLAASVELLLDQALIDQDSDPNVEISGERSDSKQLIQEPLNFELLRSLHLGVLGLQSLVDNLLESASIEVGRFRVSPRPSDLDEIIRSAVDTMQPLLEKYHQNLVLILPSQLPLVQADPRRIVQVLVNLLSNASKYGPTEAKIELRVGLKQKFVRLELIDQGPGVESTQRELLFRRFQRPDSGDQPMKVGAGLGLSVVKAIVEAHGGSVGVNNSPHGGSIFWFTIPTAREI